MARRFVGFQRIAEPGACDWCVMLASRGADYGSADSAEAGSHDGCKCVIAPVFVGDTWAGDAVRRAMDRVTGKVSRDEDAVVAIGENVHDFIRLTPRERIEWLLLNRSSLDPDVFDQAMAAAQAALVA